MLQILYRLRIILFSGQFY